MRERSWPCCTACAADHSIVIRASHQVSSISGENRRIGWLSGRVAASGQAMHPGLRGLALDLLLAVLEHER